ncbi:hypothetical protein FM106_28400 [Brachybacterium faecium]|nr:hypothetical protein FM106_28400 [Brachybacterium faecium]
MIVRVLSPRPAAQQRPQDHRAPAPQRAGTRTGPFLPPRRASLTCDDHATEVAYITPDAAPSGVCRK